MPNITSETKTHKILNKSRNLLVENTVTETDIFSYTVPANTLGTLNALHIRFGGSFLNSSGSGVTYTMRFKFGATTLFSDVTASFASSAIRRPLDFDVVLAANGATNAQVFGGNVMMSVATAATIGVGDIGTDEQAGYGPILGVDSTEDSTANKDFKLTIQPSVANVNAEVLISSVYVELIQ